MPSCPVAEGVWRDQEEMFIPNLENPKFHKSGEREQHFWPSVKKVFGSGPLVHNWSIGDFFSEPQK